MNPDQRDGLRPLHGSGWRERLRSTTALQAIAAMALLAAPFPAAAQLSPNAHPTGGQVVAGQAGIAQSATTTTVTQSSQRAAVNWQTFDVGSSQTVQFQQPSSTASTLNRVVGPNPSEIAGKIQANGQIVVVNQAGVVFDRGAQVNATGIVVSAAGISNGNFMAGKLIFDRAADPDARVVNRGTLTVSQHGLAALVAPQVRNAGAIRAPLGTVILGGAQAETLDLYGDGLVSINVTKQVTQARDGTKALVTNSGTIAAAGGSVVLTADAVDGVVQTLVDAGGRISANSTAGRTGRVLIAGEGGDVVVEGAVSAQGKLPGTEGGAIRVSGSAATVVGPKARIDASGQAGGGTVAIGTTLARARSGTGIAAATTKTVDIRQGATISANATVRGNGGRVVALSSGTTTVAGTIDAKGGPTGGNGGFVETSGATLDMGQALVDTLAPMGNAGLWLLDPDDFTIENAGQAAQIAMDLLGGNVEIQTTSTTPNAPPGTGTATAGSGDIIVNAAISAPTNTNTLQLNAYDSIQINAPVNVGTLGTLQLIAGNGIAQNAIAVVTAGTLTGNAGTGAAHIGITTNYVTNLGTFTAPMAFGLRDSVPTLTVTGTVNGGIGVYIVNSGGALAIKAPLISTNVVALTTSGGISESGLGIITSPRLTGSAGGDVMLGGDNDVATLDSFTATGYGFTLADAGASLLTVSGPVNAATVSLTAPGIDIPTANAIDGTTSIALTATGSGGTGNITEDGTGSITTPLLTGMAAGSATLDGGNAVTNLGPFTATGGFTLNDSVTKLTVVGEIDGGPFVTLNNTGKLAIDAAIDPTNTVTLIANGITQDSAGIITAGTLTGSAGTGAANLSAADNVVTDLGKFSAKKGFSLTDDVPLLTVIGAIHGGLSITLDNVGGSLAIHRALDTHQLNGTVTLEADGIGQSAAGVIVADTLTGDAGAGSAKLRKAANVVTDLGPFSAGDIFAFNDTVGTLTVVGLVGDGQSVRLNNTGALVLDGPLDATGTVVLDAAGITQDSAGIVTAGRLTGDTGSDEANFSGATNLVKRLGPFTADNFRLLDDRTLSVTGDVTAGGDVAITVEGAGNGLHVDKGISVQSGAAGTTKLTATDGKLVNDGTVLGGTLASLTAGTDIDQNATVTADTVTETAGGNLTHTGTTTAKTGNVSLTATKGTLDQNGSVTAANDATLLAGADLHQSGSVVAVAGNASLTAGGNLTQSKTVTATQGVTLTALRGNVTQTGNVTAGTHAIIQARLGNVSEGGIVQAPNIQVAAPLGTVTFSGTFQGVEGNPALNPNQPLAAGAFPSDVSIGAWLSGSTIIVAPGAQVNGAGGGAAQLVISLTSPTGSVTFDNFNSPATQLYLNLGTGFAAGQIAVAALQVQYAQPGTSATIDLTGTVDGKTGDAAAEASFIQPQVRVNYQLNGCSIGSANCGVIIPTLPQTLPLPVVTAFLNISPLFFIDPLKDLEVETPQQADDILIILPDVGERDY
jgi:filamentous hemagglutinin family protein